MKHNLPLKIALVAMLGMQLNKAETEITGPRTIKMNTNNLIKAEREKHSVSDIVPGPPHWNENNSQWGFHP